MGIPLVDFDLRPDSTSSSKTTGLSTMAENSPVARCSKMGQENCRNHTVTAQYAFGVLEPPKLLSNENLAFQILPPKSRDPWSSEVGPVLCLALR